MQKEAVPDLELNLKKKARRRLVGAISLVLLMMILLPMLLKDRDGLAKRDAIKITLDKQPSAIIESTVTERKVAENVTAKEEPFPAALPELSVAEPVTETNNVPSVNSVAKNSDGAVHALDLPNQNAKSAVDAKPKEQKVIVSETVVAETLAKKAPEPVKAPVAEKPVTEKLVIEKPVKVESKAADNKAVAGKSYFVQVGVFSDAANVKRLQAQLTQLGFKAQTEKVNTSKGEKIRLRTTSFASRNDAANALQKIKNAGLTGMVVRQ
jgi:DedD protein